VQAQAILDQRILGEIASDFEPEQVGFALLLPHRELDAPDAAAWGHAAGGEDQVL
jgi:hypothetical protein